jgi:hypothetical protein
MLGKSKGKLIHISDFIGPKGRIRMPDLDLDARKIIFPGQEEIHGGIPNSSWYRYQQLLISLRRNT